MAMEMLSRERFREELNKAGLHPTDTTSQTSRLWSTAEGQLIWVPESDAPIPDSVLEALLRQVNKLYHC